MRALMIPAAVAPAVAGAFGVLSLLHLYWAAGGRQGMVAVLPDLDGRTLFVPGAVAALIVAALLAAAAVLVAERAGFGPGWVPLALVRPGIWGVALVMLLRAVGDFRYLGFFKQVRGSRFALLDSRIFSPVALLLGLGSAWVALAGL